MSSDGDTGSGRDPDEWREKMEPGETALKMTCLSWDGPEYVGLAENGDILRWPLGSSMDVGRSEDDSQFVSDIEDGFISVETVPFEETPLTEYDGGGDDA